MHTAFLTCLFVVPMPLLAGPAEVQVNVRTASDQRNAAVAASPTGGAVIVWSSYFTTSGRSNDILLRRLDAQGAFLGDEFKVNTTTQGNQTEPAVACDGQGRVAVVWQGLGLDAEDIFMRLFQPDGNPRTDELLVSVSTTGRQLYPSVAAGGTGTIIVAWEDRVTVGGTEKATIRVQRFDPNGVVVGGPILADTATYDCRYPEVTMDQAGRFAVAWMRDRTIHPIVVRLFSADGLPLTEPLEVNKASSASVNRPSLAMNARGNFVVAWHGNPVRASENDIYVRRYDPNGVPRGEPLLVNTLRSGPQQWPQVALNDANEFVVVWENDTGDANAPEIAARYFDANGVPVGGQFQLNTYTLQEQRYPDVAMIGNGSYLAAWESNGQDGSGYGLFAILEPSLRPADPNGKD